MIPIASEVLDPDLAFGMPSLINRSNSAMSIAITPSSPVLAKLRLAHKPGQAGLMHAPHLAYGYEGAARQCQRGAADLSNAQKRNASRSGLFNQLLSLHRGCFNNIAALVLAEEQPGQAGWWCPQTVQLRTQTTRHCHFGQRDQQPAIRQVMAG
jgi:hypothetical protein